MKNTILFSEKILILVVIVSLLPIAALGGWSPRVKLSTHGISTSLNENMATCLVASGDTLHVVWSDHRMNGYAIYYTRSIDTGLSWSNAIALTDTNQKATFPAIAVSGNFVHLAWMDESLGHRASFYKRSTDGGATWGPIVILDSNTSFWPGIAASGALVVVSLNKTIPTNNTEVFFMRSTNNGVTWSAEQQISNAQNRSEDPAIAALGQDVHLSWNDKRSGTMLTYYRHSSDAGVTWGDETAITSTNSYTTMVSPNGKYVDVVDGLGSGNGFDVGLRQSSDSGRTFAVVKDLFSGIYPFLVRDGLNLHLGYDHLGTGGGAWYAHSADGGATWDTPSQIDFGGQPFLALTGCTVHVVYGDSGAVYYKRNPTGNGDCSTLNSTEGKLANVLGGDPYIDSVLIGKQACRTDTLMNMGDGDLIIDSLLQAGVNASDFSVSGLTIPFTLKGHSEAVLTICATPSTLGLLISMLTIKAHALNSNKEQTILLPVGVFGIPTSEVNNTTRSQGFGLNQNFPNPFRGVTNFNYTTPKESEVRIALLDMTGKVVKMIISGRVSEGEHSVTVGVDNLPSGSYIISLVSGSIKLARELLLIK